MIVRAFFNSCKPDETDNHLRDASGCGLGKPIVGCKWFFVQGCGVVSGANRSGCPINLTVEMLGDRWSLIVLRDMTFGNRRHYRELLNQSEEGIATNILADRLKMLVKAGMVTKSADPTHKQREIYSLTEKSIALVPLFAQLGAWGRRYTPATKELSIRAQLLEEGGPPMWNQFMIELRERHLGQHRQGHGPTVAEKLQTAYDKLRSRAEMP
jgi:DNA-binding HxlR family transcriptional regulator